MLIDQIHLLGVLLRHKGYPEVVYEGCVAQIGTSKIFVFLQLVRSSYRTQ